MIQEEFEPYSFEVQQLVVDQDPAEDPVIERKAWIFWGYEESVSVAPSGMPVIFADADQICKPVLCITVVQSSQL